MSVLFETRLRKVLMSMSSNQYSGSGGLSAIPSSLEIAVPARQTALGILELFLIFVSLGGGRTNLAE